MRKIHLIELLGVLFLLLGVMSSCKDDDESLLKGTGIKDQSWVRGQTYHIAAEQTLTFTFYAQSSWTVQSSSNALFTLSTYAGNAGKNTLKVTAHQSSQKTGDIKIRVNGYQSSYTIQFELTENPSSLEINYLVDQYLKERYLWNNEYKTLTPDFTLDYDNFLNTTLMSMATNTLDKKSYIDNDGKTYYTLFSYIEKLNPDLQTTRSAKEAKRQEYNFGFINFLIVSYSKPSDPTRYVCFAVQGVHPNSSASKAGVKRGMNITHVDGVTLTESNWTNYIYRLLMPSSQTTTIIKDVLNKDLANKTYTISSAPIYVNPVTYSTVKTINTHKIGYLVYSSFEASFDEELFNVFKNFKTQGITDLILDLRYNGGGHVMSANLISSCIAGAPCDNQTFAEYRYNAERMSAYGNVRPVEKFAYSKYPNLNDISLSAGALNLKRVYCLVTGSSASASELVINALRGIDIEVILIGTTTRGKNVGMEGVKLTTSSAVYELFPITFQTYNAKKFGDYEKGFNPTHLIDENGTIASGFEGYKDFGADDEVLYAKAVSLITGNNVLNRSSIRSSSQMTGTALPQIIEVKRIGMVK